MFRPFSPLTACLLALTLAIALSPSHVSAQQNPEDITALVAFDSSPIDGRTPLILVHGIWGNQWQTGLDDRDSPNWPYWQEFLMFYAAWDLSGLKEKYKIYGFFYESDKLPVSEIALGLRYWIDQRTSVGTLPDTPFVILAHSMGGLVSRAFMEQQNYGEGSGSLWEGQLGRLG